MGFHVKLRRCQRLRVKDLESRDELTDVIQGDQAPWFTTSTPCFNVVQWCNLPWSKRSHRCGRPLGKLLENDLRSWWVFYTYASKLTEAKWWWWKWMDAGQVSWSMILIMIITITVTLIITRLAIICNNLMDTYNKDHNGYKNGKNINNNDVSCKFIILIHYIYIHTHIWRNST